MFIVIPNLLISVQRDNEILIDEKNPNDIINIRPPQESSVYYENTTGNGYGVYVSGDYAYIADGLSGLAVIDISDPTNPGTPVYEALITSAWAIDVSGDYAYVANGNAGLAVIDISDPTNPETPIYENTGGWAWEIYVSGDYAYVADGSSGLAVIDISDPTNPGTPVYESTSGNANGVYVSGDYAYVAAGTSGLAVIDISDPTNPGTPFYEDTDGTARSVFISGDYAYVPGHSSGLAVIDISDPTNPETPVYEDISGVASSVYVSGDYAYVTDEFYGLVIIDISDPTNPGTPIYENMDGYTRDVYVSGNYAYLADGDQGLAVVDISENIDPTIPIYEDTSGSARGVFISGDYAYIADHDSGLAIIDISDPTNPGTPVYEDMTWTSRDVYVDGDYAYLADGDSGLAIIDISDPTNPGTPVYEDTYNAYAVYVSGDYAYVADQSAGLAVIDISDPTNPGTPFYEVTTGDAWDVQVSGDYAYVAVAASGLDIIDISDPTNPGTPFNEDTGQAYGIDVSGNYAYIADNNYGLAVIDISDPTNPGTPVYEDTTGWAHDVFISGDYAYVADYNPGLAVIDISDPTNPGTPVYEDTAGFPNGVYVSGDYAYVADSTTGLAVIQVRQRYHLIAPVISSAPSDFSAEQGYTGQSISWTATDTNPDTYTIELQGTGIVAGPTIWTSGAAINYNIPEGFSVGSHEYFVNFTDVHGNSVLNNFTFTVEDTTSPNIIYNTPVTSVEEGYTGQTVSWNATDLNPNTYTIEFSETGLVAGPTAWTSGVAITYNIPDGIATGYYHYTVNFTDDYGNWHTDNVNFTVEINAAPEIINSPGNINVEFGYTGQSLSWTATDTDPDTYTIELQGSGIIDGPSAWISGNAINYNIPDGFGPGDYIYTINFADEYSFVNDSVTFTVQAMADPVITLSPNNFNVECGYTGQSLSWTGTDLSSNTYTIELQGTGIVAGPTAWTPEVAIIYNIPDGFGLGDYIYTVNFTDDYGNFITDSVTFTVEDTTTPIITFSSNDITIEVGYSDLDISWTATDIFPGTYTIELVGSGISVGPLTWSSGDPINYTIPDGFASGVYTFNITITDDNGNSASGIITVTITSGTPGGIPFGNAFLIITVLSIIGLIFTKKRQIVRKSR